ncbi:MFS transporter [Vibrio brasiliensis]|uniref:MFS transporter n=1 Tax=Vibrio brasiliensis TaxID=170652 RepID=UPI001EFDEE3B|nr:MFS transporter [Vibrio brasiliensis]MCG9647743.1 MFS transporter [Vibrio brasiliensis]
MNTLTEPQSSIWRNQTFQILFSSALFVAFSAQIYNLALPLLVYELTESSQMMGWMRAVEFLPNLLLALFIGVIVDRVDKKRWSQAMLLGQLLVVVCSYMAVEWLSQPLWVLFPAAFLMMAFNYGYANARMTMLKQALPQQVQNTAVARMSSLSSVMETIGPVLSGVLMIMSAIHNVFLVVAILLLLAYWQLERMTLSPSEPAKWQGIWVALTEGWTVFRAEKNMWHITLAVMVINTTGAVFWIQAIFFAKSQLAFNSVEVSYMIAASGIGGLIGSFSADRVRKKIGLGVLLIASITLEAVGFLVPLMIANVWGLVMSFLWISAVGLFSSICIWTYRQEVFEQQYLGRVAGITGSLFKLLMPVGLAASGYITVIFGVEVVFSACFVIQLLVAAVLCMTQVRKIS